jgi:hypothetical protein
LGLNAQLDTVKELITNINIQKTSLLNVAKDLGIKKGCQEDVLIKLPYVEILLDSSLDIMNKVHLHLENSLPTDPSFYLDKITSFLLYIF